MAGIPSLAARMRRLTVVVGGCALAAVVAVAFALMPAPGHVPSASATSQIAMVVDDATDSVVVFDVATDAVLGSVPIGSGSNGDCAITADGTLGFATDFANRVWVIDLTTSTPSLATGTNPIPISNFGEDLSISPDQKFLVVADGSAPQPISVIDITSRTEIGTFSLGADANSVEVLGDGSVLATSTGNGSVRRLTIDGAGNLTNTGESLSSGGEPNNVFGASIGASGVVITRYEHKLRSFTIPGLTLVDTRTLSGDFGISGLVHPDGDRVYARSNGGAVDVFSYNAATGALGAVPLFSVPISDTTTYFGMEQMAVTSDGAKLYVSQPNALNVYNASDGGLLTSITDPSIVSPTGVCLQPSAPGPKPTPTPCAPEGCPTPTNTRTRTPTGTSTLSPTSTATGTPTATATPTATGTPSATPCPPGKVSFPGGCGTATPTRTPTRTPTPCPTQGCPSLDFSMGVDTNGDNVDDCRSSAGGPAKCTLPPGSTFKLKAYLNSLPSGLSGYVGLDLSVTYTGVSSKNNASTAAWPDCAFPASFFVLGHVRWGCAVGIGAGPSSYTGLIGTNDFNCAASGTITLVHGPNDTTLTDLEGVPYVEVGTESLTINCVAVTATPTHTPHPMPLGGVADYPNAGSGGGAPWRVGVLAGATGFLALGAAARSARRRRGRGLTKQARGVD